MGIWTSKFIDGKWTKPIEVVNSLWEKDVRYPCWNPVLFKSENNELLLFYKVGPDPQSWWGMLIRSYDEGETWMKPEKLPDGFLGPIKNRPFKLKNGDILYPASTEHDGWKVHFETSDSEVKNWKKYNMLESDTNFSVIQPSILEHGGDTLQMVCRSMDGYIINSFSYDLGKNWTKMSKLNLPNPNSGTDGLTLKNGKHLLVYNHTGMIEGRWGGLRYPLNVASSNDGIYWETIFLLEDEPGEFSYPSVIQSSDGKIHITYTYKRKTIKHVVIDPNYIK